MKHTELREENDEISLEGVKDYRSAISSFKLEIIRYKVYMIQNSIED